MRNVLSLVSRLSRHLRCPTCGHFGHGTSDHCKTHPAELVIGSTGVLRHLCWQCFADAERDRRRSAERKLEQLADMIVERLVRRRH